MCKSAFGSSKNISLCNNFSQLLNALNLTLCFQTVFQYYLNLQIYATQTKKRRKEKVRPNAFYCLPFSRKCYSFFENLKKLSSHKNQIECPNLISLKIVLNPNSGVAFSISFIELEPLLRNLDKKSN